MKATSTKPSMAILTTASVALMTISSTQAATLVNVSDIAPNSTTIGDVTATVTDGTFSTTTGSSPPNNNGGNPATLPALVNSTTYGLKLTNLTIDGISGIDLTWDLTLTANPGAGVVLNGPTWTVESDGPPMFDIEAFRINALETLTFSVTNVVATATSGGSVTDASFIGFTAIDLTDGTGGVFDAATGLVSHSGGSATDFRARRLDTQFSITAVPEPSSAGLLGLAGLALLLRRRK